MSDEGKEVPVVDDEERRPPPNRHIPRGPWTGRVTFSDTEDGLPFAFRPHEVITTRAAEALVIANQAQPEEAPRVEIVGARGPFSKMVQVQDPVRVVEELRVAGIVAQLNHVYFTHSLEGSPVYGSPVYGSPVYGSPVYGSPVYGSPVYGSPVYGSPVYGSEHAAPKRSSARPPADKVSPSLYSRIHRAAADDSPHVIVLDTGLAKPPFRPHALTGGAVHACTAADRDEPDELGDGVLDPAAGHGTFITGVIAQVAPGCEITHHRVLSTFGDGAEWDVIDCLIDMLPLPDPKRTILNLSFGGYVLDHPHALAWAIRKVREHGAQVVASAGNDAISRPTFPAALPGVVAVGAIGPSGPAPFSNYGAWVNAAAPGYELLSTFFQKFEEAEEAEEDEDDDGATGTDDPDEFQGWAIWSGTSFSAPVVVGNLARLMMADTAMNGHAAVRRLLDAPAVMRIPNLGVVVNFM